MSDAMKEFRQLFAELLTCQALLTNPDHPMPYSLEEAAEVRKEMRAQEAHENRREFVKKKCGGKK